MKRWGKAHPTIRFALAAATLLLAASPGSASADDFNWGPSLGTINTGFGSYTINGLDFTSPVENQVSGTCWDFAGIAALEAKYMLTRNDTAYSIDLSEEQTPMLLGGDFDAFTNGGWSGSILQQACYGGGIVQESELPTNYDAPYLPPAGEWPLKPGWQNRAVVSTGFCDVAGSVAALKAGLKAYGPGVICVGSGYFYYPSSSGGTDATGVAGVGINHVVSVVGYHDATSADDAAIREAGGYWIIKNSWGTGFCDGGYGYVPYNLINDIGVFNGPAYYTGAMATATWQGPGAWTLGGSNWTSSSGTSWVNQETAAVFNFSSNNNITISGPVIAHSLTFNSGATGYVFSGGSLTITAGGVSANESVTINSPVTIGAPQTWTTAAGGTLTVNGNVSTNISTLTVAGAGATVINGVVGDGGPMSMGGGLTVCGPGTLTLTASNTYSNLTTVNGGALILSGSGGAVASSSSAGITLSGGTLLLDNSAANNNNRIAGAIPLTLQGGELSLVGNAAGTSQAVNSILLQPGGVISVTAGSNTASLTIGSLTRSAGDVALVCGTALGTASSGSVAQIVFATAPTLSNSATGSAIGILPYFYGDNSPSGNGTDLVTYGGNGLRLLAASEYSGTVAANTNVKLAGNASVSNSTSILALVLANSGTATQLTLGNSATLTLTSGAVLSAGDNGNSINGGTLTFGNNAATSYEGIVHTAADLTIGSVIADNAGNPVTLTKSGPAVLLLTGINTYSGATLVSAGSLTAGVNNALPPSSAVTVNSTFNLNGYADTIGSLAGSGTVTLGGGTLAVGNDNTSTSFSGLISGAGNLSKIGTGTLTISGTLDQTGGWNSVNKLAIGSQGCYQFSGGTLQINGNGLANQGVFDATGSTGLLSVKDSILDLSTGNWQNTGSLSLCVCPNSLLLVPAGYDPAAAFAGNSTLGLTHTIGTTLTVPAGQGFSGSGSLADSVSCQGWISAAAGGSIDLNGGVTVSGSGSVSLGQGSFTVNDALSGITAGSLSANQEFVGPSGSGSFTQSGGTNSVSGGLFIGNCAAVGGYNLGSSGLLSVLDEQIGNYGNGSFTQSGGTNSMSFLYLGCFNGGSGTYNLSGSGLLSGTQESIGNWGVGSFTQSGGTNSCALWLGNYAGGSGTYNLSGSGLLSATIEGIGNYGSGSFTQSGGTNSGALWLGINPGSSGTYNLSGSGLLSAPNEQIGNDGTGSFTQSGGTNSVSSPGCLYLADNADGSGTYDLSGSGLLSVPNEHVGNSGAGSFTQSGGTHTVSNGLYLGYNAGSSGSFNLSGSGRLFAQNEVIGLSGSGMFTQSGGTNTVKSTLSLGGAGTYNLTGGALLVPGIQGTGTFNLGGGTLVASDSFSTGQAMTLTGSGGNGNIDTGGYAVTLSGALSGPGGLNEWGAGILTLTGSNTYTGGTIVSAGTLIAAAKGAIDAGTSLTVGAGAASISSPFSGLATWTSSSGSAWNNASNWVDNNNVPGVPGIAPRPDNTDTAAFSGSGSVTAIDLTGVNPSLKALSFSTSNYTLSGGSLTLNDGSGTATVTVTSGTQTIGSLLCLAGSADMVVSNSPDLLTIAGRIVGSGALLKDGAGTLILSGCDNYLGGTIVDAGTLCVENCDALCGATSLTVGANGAFPFDAPAAAAGETASGETSPGAVVAVPEPGTLLLLVTALWSARIYCRVPRRSKTAAAHTLWRPLGARVLNCRNTAARSKG